MEHKMWDSKKSLNLSIICTYAIIILLIVFSISLPFFNRIPIFEGTLFFDLHNMKSYLPFLYGSSVAEFIVLFTLRKLLLNIKKQKVFTTENVKLLRIISWGCFASAIILAVGTISSVTFFFLAIIAGFFGLIIRVVKNVIAAAVELKEDVDFTI